MSAIVGHRNLTQDEIDMINTIKEVEVTLGSLVRLAKATVDLQKSQASRIADDGKFAEIERLEAAEPGRWIAMARTHFQEGVMALTRAIAQPGSPL